MFSIGADPELFLKNHDNKLISVVGLIGGTKQQPMPIGNGCAVQEDNVAAEFCIPACYSANEFVTSIQYALGDIQIRADKLGLTLANMVASASFDPDQLKTRKAREFGCDPDFNAYTLEVNPRPKADDKTLRSAGGHVHIGTDKPVEEVIRTLDLFLGVPSVIMDPDERRRQLYGKAGCFRPKPYGAEYRTLSNYWIWNQKTIEWVYHQVNDGLLFSDEFNREASRETFDEIQDCINNNNKKLAEELIEKWTIKLP
jgi:hypothetical protein